MPGVEADIYYVTIIHSIAMTSGEPSCRAAIQ